MPIKVGRGRAGRSLSLSFSVSLFLNSAVHGTSRIPFRAKMSQGGESWPWFFLPLPAAFCLPAFFFLALSIMILHAAQRGYKRTAMFCHFAHGCCATPTGLEVARSFLLLCTMTRPPLPTLPFPFPRVQMVLRRAPSADPRFQPDTAAAALAGQDLQPGGSRV